MNPISNTLGPISTAIARKPIHSQGVFADDEAAYAGGVTYGQYYIDSLGELRQFNKKKLTTITAMGSSTVSKGSQYNPATNTWAFYGEGFLHNFIKLAGQNISLIRDSGAGNPVPLQYHFGIPSTTLVQHLQANGLVDRMIAALAAERAAGREPVAVIQCGRNDTGGAEAAATTVANVQTIFTRATAAGVEDCLVIMNDAPRLYNTAGPDERTILPIRYEKNARLRTLAETYNALYLDTNPYPEDVARIGYSDTTLVDGTRPGHWEIQPGWRVAIALYNLLATRYVFGPRLELGDIFTHANVLNANPRLTGTAGSGGRPTGVSAGNNGATTAEFMVVPYDDFATTGRYWLRTMMNANADDGDHQLSIATSAAFTVGDTLEAMVEIRFPYLTAVQISAISKAYEIGSFYLSIFRNGTFVGGSDGQPVVGLNSPPAILDYTTKTLVLRTMPWTVDTGTTDVTIRLNVSGSGAYDIGTPILVKNASQISGLTTLSYTH
jgi:hypothetical protein